MDLVFVQIYLIHWCEFKFNFFLFEMMRKAHCRIRKIQIPMNWQFHYSELFFISLSPSFSFSRALSLSRPVQQHSTDHQTSHNSFGMANLHCFHPLYLATEKRRQKTNFYRKRLSERPKAVHCQRQSVIVCVAILMKLSKETNGRRMMINCLVQKAKLLNVNRIPCGSIGQMWSRLFWVTFRFVDWCSNWTIHSLWH